MIHLKYFQVHTVFTKIPVNKTFVCPLTVSERMFFGAETPFRHTTVLINVAFTISVDRKVTKYKNIYVTSITEGKNTFSKA